MTEKDIKELSIYLQTYEGNKNDFMNGVKWAVNRDYNPIVCMALESYLEREEKDLEESV